MPLSSALPPIDTFRHSTVSLLGWLLITVALATRTCVAADAPAAANPSIAQSIAAGRERVRDADAHDYFYWKRFLYRHDNPGEFPLPASWYNPQALVTGAPSNPLPYASARQRGVDAGTLRELDAYLAAQDTGAFYLVRGGRIEHEYHGGGTRAGSLLPVRSITKSLLGLLIGIAIGDGAIGSVDDPVSRYLPEWSHSPRGAITLRQLLNMSSGLEYVTLAPEPDNRAMQLAEGSRVDAVALDWPMTSAPNTSFTVNQVDSQVLGIVLQRATRSSLVDYLSEKLWQPLGLSPATLNIDATGQPRAFCCMRVVGADLLKVGQMLLQNGRWNGQQLVPAEWIRAMREPSPISPDVGLHVFLGRDRGAPEPDNPYRPARELLRASGVYYLQGGLSVVLWIVPSHDLVIFRWGNDRPGWDMAKIPNLIIDALDGRRGGAAR